MSECLEFDGMSWVFLKSWYDRFSEKPRFEFSCNAEFWQNVGDDTQRSIFPVRGTFLSVQENEEKAQIAPIFYDELTKVAMVGDCKEWTLPLSTVAVLVEYATKEQRERNTEVLSKSVEYIIEKEEERSDATFEQSEKEEERSDATFEQSEKEEEEACERCL